MIRLLPHRRRSARSELDEVKRVLRCLQSSPSQTRVAVGAGVAQANSDFLRQFGDMQAFRQTPAEAREQFYSR